MLEIAIEFKCARFRHRDDPDQVLGWRMVTIGKIDGVGHQVLSLPFETYPKKRQIAMFFARSTRQIRDWFDGPAYQAALQRVAEQRPSLIVIPGRG